MIIDYERRIQALEARVQALEDALKKERAAQVPDAQTQEKVTAQSSPAPAVQTPEKAPEQSLAAAAETREKNTGTKPGTADGFESDPGGAGCTGRSELLSVHAGARDRDRFLE